MNHDTIQFNSEPVTSSKTLLKKPNFITNSIEDEYKLIQDKKSKLSRSQREWVIRQYNKLTII